MGEVASSSLVSTNALKKLSVLEILFDKELTANWLVGTRPKVEELIKVQLPLWLQQSLFNGISWNDLSWTIVVSEHP